MGIMHVFGSHSSGNVRSLGLGHTPVMHASFPYICPMGRRAPLIPTWVQGRVPLMSLHMIRLSYMGILYNHMAIYGSLGWVALPFMGILYSHLSARQGLTLMSRIADVWAWPIAELLAMCGHIQLSGSMVIPNDGFMLHGRGAYSWLIWSTPIGHPSDTHCHLPPIQTG